MSRPATGRTYGSSSSKHGKVASKAERLFAELKQASGREKRGRLDAIGIGIKETEGGVVIKSKCLTKDDDGDDDGNDSDVEVEMEKENENRAIDSLVARIANVTISDSPRRSPRKARQPLKPVIQSQSQPQPQPSTKQKQNTLHLLPSPPPASPIKQTPKPPDRKTKTLSGSRPTTIIPKPNLQHYRPLSPSPSLSRPPVNTPGSFRELRSLSWVEVCPPGDTITKIAEASFAEVYRVTNALGTSIIKTIRLPSPIKALTLSQARAQLVDEEPHLEEDIDTELQISEWLASVPGFIVYKERYVVTGRTTPMLLDTHRKFQGKLKRKDAERAQFYPSPARYLDGTKFLVVELGDAGTALEDFDLETPEELWDIFLLVALAMARAEEWAAFEHRDLHEGNICVRRVGQARTRAEMDGDDGRLRFGYSGLDVTILDYGISRATCPGRSGAEHTVAYDLERDLGLFASTHAPHCVVYRQMRSHLLHGGRECLPPEQHNVPYPPVSWSVDAEDGGDGDDNGGATQSLAWTLSAPYTNVLWLWYLYSYLAGRGPSGKGAAFKGPRPTLKRFRQETAELRQYLDPNEGLKKGLPCFGSAVEVVNFAVEAGWIDAAQVMGEDGVSLRSIKAGGVASIIGSAGGEDGLKRRSPRLG